MKLSQLPLRVWIPGVMVLLALFLTTVTITHDWLHFKRAEKRTLARTVAWGEILAASVQISFVENRSALDANLAKLRVFPNLRRTLVVDASGTIVLAADPALKNRPLLAHATLGAANTIESARQSRQSQTHITADGRTLLAAFPFAMAGSAPNPAASNVLYLELDLQGVERVEIMDLLEHSLVMILVSGLTCTGAWLYFRRTFEHRLNGLVAAIATRAEGGQQPIPTDGEDELTRIGHAVKKMADDMTAQDAAVRGSEARLQEAQRVAQLGSWMWEPSGKLSVTNYIYELFSLDPTQPMTFKTFIDAIHPEDRVRVRQGFQAWATSDRRHNREEFRILRPDGSVRQLLAVGDLIRGPKNEPRYAVGTVQDITERKLVEQTLRNQAARQAVLLDLSSAVSSAPQTRETLIHIVFERVAPLLKADVGFNFQVEGNTLRLVAAVGVPAALQPQLEHLKFEGTFCNAVAESGVSVTRVGDELATDPKGKLLFGMGVSAYLCHPLRSSEGRIVGTFSLGRREPVAFGPEEIESHQTICHFISLAWERIAAEEEVRASEDRFRSVVEAAPSAMLLVNSAGQITLVNQQLEKLFGYTRDELIGQTLETLLPARNRSSHATLRADFLRAPAQRAMGEGRDLFGQRKDGTEVAVEIGLSPINRPEGRFVLAAVVDITERTRSERALKESEARFREIAETINDVFWVSDPEKLLVLYVSPAYETVWGRSCASLIANPYQWVEAIHEDDRERVLHAARTRQIAGTYDEQYRIVRPDGTLRWIHDRAFPVRDATGKVVRLAGIADDITDSKVAEAERIRLAAFPQLNPNAVLELSDRGRILYANVAATRLASELSFQDPAEMLPPDIADLVNNCLHGTTSVRRLERTYGSRVVAWSLYPVDGRHVVHCYAEDITERRSLEEQVRQSQKMEALGQLAGGVAHDFNNILAVFMLQLDLASRLLGPGMSPAVADSLNELRKGAQRAAALTRQLLLFGRREVMQFSRIDLNELLENLAKMLRRIVGEDIDFVLSEGSTPLWVEVDPGMIEQVVVNLCVNARDAMPNGGRLTVEARRYVVDEAHVRAHVDAKPGVFACLAVTDTGTGIDPAILPRIFEPFFTTKEVGRGTGLGLATVSGVIKQHQSWLEIETAAGKGTTFRTYLPLVAMPEDQPALAQPSASPAMGGAETVLLVEDEAMVRMVVAMTLKQQGYAVLEAESGPEGWRRWEANRGKIALVLSDMTMPGGMSGLDLAEKIWTEQRDLPFLIFSGYSTSSAAAKRAAAANHRLVYVAKPCESTHLLNLVRELLDHRHQRLT